MSSDGPHKDRRKREPPRRLRSGFTTGTAAAAAAKAALVTLVTGTAPRSVTIPFLSAGKVTIPVHRTEHAGDHCVACTVIKDAGDDPDITHRAEIGAAVTVHPGSRDAALTITGGIGVGRVTKPGLEIRVGEPAINPGPRRMISEAVEDVRQTASYRRDVTVEVFVPQGEALARKTLNGRLGIIGGISILGTTGVVRPMSHEAYVATIRSALSVARAMGLTGVVMTTGRRSERFAQETMTDLPEEAFIQVGDYFRNALEMAAEKGLAHITLAVFFGKAVKMARGIPHTHAGKASQTLDALGDWTLKVTGDRDLAVRVRQCNTAREAFGIIHPDHPAVITHVGHRVIDSGRRFAGSGVQVDVLIFDFNGVPVFTTGRKNG